MNLIKPPSLKQGDFIGVFTPSWPAHVFLHEKYLQGLDNLREMGFLIKEGRLTKEGKSQGYRSGSPSERAEEFMQLVLDPEVKCIISVIGGLNSSSMLPYLDYNLIRCNPKIICGYSDVTALHLAILKMSGLCCFYGPAIVPSFGEDFKANKYTFSSFLDSVTNSSKKPIKLQPPKIWSNQFIDASKQGWKDVKRQYAENTGWIVHRPGYVEAPLLPVNLDTLVAISGTEYFPNIDNCILMIEEMHLSLDNFERNLSQLKLQKVFNKISGLIFSKPERVDYKGADFNEIDLLLEILGPEFSFPIISNFDCGHTTPMITLQQMISVKINAIVGVQPTIEIMEPMVTI